MAIPKTIQEAKKRAQSLALRARSLDIETVRALDCEAIELCDWIAIQVTSDKANCAACARRRAAKRDAMKKWRNGRKTERDGG